MFALRNGHWCRRLFVLSLILCLMLPTGAMAMHLKDKLHSGMVDAPFSVLIMGDSQMAGAGWEDGYANCISEGYPDAEVINLAQNGSLLANGNIYEQWEYFLSKDLPMPDIVLLDGGSNDLFYMKRKGYEEETIELIQESLRSLIKEIHEESPDTHIIYILMPPLEEWRDSENGPPSYDIQDTYWQYMNIIASSYDYVTVLDLFSLNPFSYPCTECYRENFADGIHLNETGYRNTFEYIDNILLIRLVKKLED